MALNRWRTIRLICSCQFNTTPPRIYDAGGFHILEQAQCQSVENANVSDDRYFRCFSRTSLQHTGNMRP